jgi:hypothetical protein
LTIGVRESGRATRASSPGDAISALPARHNHGVILPYFFTLTFQMRSVENPPRQMFPVSNGLCVFRS